uniref:Uncharacterized protein n=1 Tax=Rhizophora mucronata TaxID=61149 RepID=A0A2P2N904_RHIMU
MNRFSSINPSHCRKKGNVILCLVDELLTMLLFSI